MLSFADFKDATGKTDWNAYRAAKIARGEQCYECGALIYPEKGYRSKCETCAKLDRDGGEVRHPSHVRCPKCRYTQAAYYGDNYAMLEEGERSITCGDCDHEFTVKVWVNYTYESPALLPDEDEDADDPE